MKSIAIIGAGVCGLRAGIELARSSQFAITIWEKSRSVGGRVATRRFNQGFVNHGCDDLSYLKDLISHDAYFSQYDSNSWFSGEATKVPKALKDILVQNKNVQINFSAEVTSIEDNTLSLSNGQNYKYDHILVTAPGPQVNKLLGRTICEARYDKKILFIGPGLRHFMPDSLTDEIFDLSEEEIRSKAQSLGIPHHNLELKKWRYANVVEGHTESFLPLFPFQSIAGDAFDPDLRYGLWGSWRSGMAAAKDIIDFLDRGQHLLTLA